jgi:putative protease
MEKVELLAPAGSIESLYAAVNNGANAVYLGGNKFSARAYASNFDNEQMKLAVDYCHSYNVKIFVTMNTVLKESEISEAIKYAGYLYEIGVDALIIQDLGLFNLLQSKYPDFELHASTQLTIHNGEGALYYKDKGFARIVLSRELSLNEIKHISKDLKIETEMFIHGALCVCYSGKCLMSSLIGARSGNRGRCAQPCRMEYTLSSNKSGEKRGYLLSPKDICVVDDIGSIIDSGVYSLKIEGRMKRPEYVAGVVDVYRNAIDKLQKGSSYDILEGKRTLLQLFNREGFSNGYLYKNLGKDMMSYKFPKNTGVEIGTINQDGSIKLKENISVGDGIRVRDTGFTLSKIIKNKSEERAAFRNDIVKLFPTDYKKGDVLYRTSSVELFNELEKSISQYIKKIGLLVQVNFIVGQSLKLTAKYNNEVYQVEGDIVENAQSRPLEKTRIEEALQKSGEYPYKIVKVQFSEYESGFLRIASINNLRRELFDKIIKTETARYRRRRTNQEVENNKLQKNNKEIGFIYSCCKKEQLNALLDNNIQNIAVDLFYKGNDSISLKDLEDINNTNVYLKLPEIIKGEFDNIIDTIEGLRDRLSGLITSNAGIIKRYSNKLTLIGDHKLNILNSKAIEFYQSDLDIVTLSLELNRKEIKDIIKGKEYNTAYVVYGKTEMMVSEYCPIGSTFGGRSKTKQCNQACLKDEYILFDRMKEGFRVMTDKYCRSHILNSTPLNLIGEVGDLKANGIGTFRVDFTDETREQVINVIESVDSGAFEDSKSYTKGHYRRGVK